MPNECRKGPPGWALACVKGRLIRRELAEGTSGIPMLAARVARCGVSRPGQRDIPTFAAKECLGGELAEHMPTFLRNPYGISRGILRACPAGFLGHAPRGFRSPHGLLTLSMESSRSPRNPYGIPVEVFPELRSVLHNVKPESLRSLFYTPGVRHLRESGSLHRLERQPGASA